ncbi:MAG: JAB domain-containing protein [Firmicutes bacterium]|nr:JAB domain-containing protein [Bacillota bacterium]
MSIPNLLQVREVEITYKNHPDLLQRPKIAQTTDVVDIMRSVENMQKNIDYKEVFYAIYVNQGGRVLSVGKVAEGTATCCQANIRQILQGALLQNATGLFICHNHPSADTKPSRQDRQITAMVKDAVNLLDIQLIDSLIISSFNYFSFLENGLI